MPVAYALWIVPLTALPTLAWLRRGADSFTTSSRGLMSMTWNDVLRGLGGGASSLASHALALWAMTVAAVAPVAVLRETAMRFGVVLARRTLRERVPARTWVGVLLIALGAVALRLG